MLRTALQLSLAAVLLVTAAGCASTPHGPPGEHGEHGKGEHHEKHPPLPPAVKAYHEDLAPLWHAEKGPDRVAKTCAQAPALRDKATAITTAPRPENAVEAAWKDRAQDLLTATGELAAACEKEGRPDFEPRFVALHERFHALVDLLDR